MRTLPYEICDVFTTSALMGNALAVFMEADGLSTSTMQALARETNLSESAFLMRPENGSADARLRIFTPTMELGFAGHPTLGSAFVLARRPDAPQEVRLQTNRGAVTVRFTAEAAGVPFGWMTQPLPRREAFESVPELLRALGVSASTSPVELYDNGPRYVLLELATPDEIAALTPDMARLTAFGSLAFVVFANNDSHWKVRVFAPGEGIPEDPGTGAAAGALVVHLCHHGRIQYGEQIRIEQGVEIARPSELYARTQRSNGALSLVEVGGSAVHVASGHFLVPEI